MFGFIPLVDMENNKVRNVIIRFELDEDGKQIFIRSASIRDGDKDIGLSVILEKQFADSFYGISPKEGING